MPAALSVRRVESKADLRTFITFPWTVYKNDPYWVPPLVSMQKHRLDQAHAAAWEYMEGDNFIAWRGDQPVGTITAFINHRHDEYWNERVRFFGMYEVLDDQESASALLVTAAGHVAAKEVTVLRGPARRLAWLLLGVELAQGTIGFAQYFTDLPIALVAAHLVGAAVLVVAGTRLLLSVRSPISAPTESSPETPPRH